MSKSSSGMRSHFHKSRSGILPATRRFFSMRQVGRNQLSSSELLRKSNSEKVIVEATEQTDDDLIEMFDRARRAGEFMELDPIRIFEREIRLSNTSAFMASTQNFEDLEFILDGLHSDEELSDMLESGDHLVRFSEVSIQEYPIIPGDNPGGLKGAPITIAWQPVSSLSIDINKYERARRDHRRCTGQMRMNAAHRQTLLKSLGHHPREIAKAARNASRDRSRRSTTILRMDQMDREERLERVRSNVVNFLSFGKKRKEEKRILSGFSREVY